MGMRWKSFQVMSSFHSLMRVIQIHLLPFTITKWSPNHLPYSSIRSQTFPFQFQFLTIYAQRWRWTFSTVAASRVVLWGEEKRSWFWWKMKKANVCFTQSSLDKLMIRGERERSVAYYYSQSLTVSEEYKRERERKEWFCSTDRKNARIAPDQILSITKHSPPFKSPWKLPKLSQNNFPYSIAARIIGWKESD